MSSTTSKRLRRVWGIVDSAAETGAVVVSIAYLEAALVGGEKWAKLEALAAQAPLPPDEYRTAYADALASSPPDRFGPFEPGPDYEFWYSQELDRLSAEQDKILNAPDVVA